MKRFKHNLSCFRNTTANMGDLTPIGCTEVLQGDTFKHNTNMFLRVSPLAYPVMHPVHTHLHHVFVPIRLLWDNGPGDRWTDFITKGEDFDDDSVVPTITFDGAGDNPDPITAGSLGNQLGLPVGFNGTVSAFKFRAIALIYNETIRDDQLQDEVGLSLAGGPDTTTNTEMLQANWTKDYFTSARPDEQLGDELTLSLTGEAPVNMVSGEQPQIRVTSTGDLVSSSPLYGTNTGNLGNSSNLPFTFDPNGSLEADMSQVSGFTLNELRMFIATNQWQEHVNRTGNKFEDYLKRYGVKYSDARLQRPEYLAGGKQTIQFSEVIQTGPESAGGGVGSLKGHGIAAMRSNNYIKFFEEPGLVVSFLQVKPIPMYMQALHRSWFRFTPEDYYQKEYDMLGMQEITNKEVMWDHSVPDGTFGYAPRHQEYREQPNTVHGEFETLLKDFHLAREFGGDIALNSSFITCNPSNRIFQSSSTAQFQCTVQHKLAARRVVPKYWKPSGLKL